MVPERRYLQEIRLFFLGDALLKAEVRFQASDEWRAVVCFSQRICHGSSQDLFITSQCGQLQVSDDFTTISIFTWRHYHQADDSNPQRAEPYSSQILWKAKSWTEPYNLSLLTAVVRTSASRLCLLMLGWISQRLSRLWLMTSYLTAGWRKANYFVNWKFNAVLQHLLCSSFT